MYGSGLLSEASGIYSGRSESLVGPLIEAVATGQQHLYLRIHCAQMVEGFTAAHPRHDHVEHDERHLHRRRLGVVGPQRDGRLVVARLRVLGDLDAAIDAATWLETQLEKTVPGLVMKAGGFPKEQTAA